MNRLMKCMNCGKVETQDYNEVTRKFDIPKNWLTSHYLESLTKTHNFVFCSHNCHREYEKKQFIELPYVLQNIEEETIK